MNNQQNSSTVSAENADIVASSKALVADIKSIIEQGRQQAYSAINTSMIVTYWNIGRRIIEEEQHGEKRAEYGEYLAHRVADALESDYGNTFNYRNICYFRQFYLYFNNIEIVNARVHNLTWTHIRHLLRVTDEKARLKDEIARQKEIYRLQCQNQQQNNSTRM